MHETDHDEQGAPDTPEATDEAPGDSWEEVPTEVTRQPRDAAPVDDAAPIGEVDDVDGPADASSLDDSAAVIASLEERVATLEHEREASRERLLRMAADHENHKRRVEREKEELRKFGNERVLLDMFPVLDNLERALVHSGDESGSLVEGVQMVQRQFKQVLARHGVESFDSVGEPFDPQRHEAVQQVDADDHEPNTVVEEYQKGYYLNGRLIRPAMVVVSKRSAE